MLNFIIYKIIKKREEEYQKAKKFDMSFLDKLICKWSEYIYKTNKSKFNNCTNRTDYKNRIGIMATVLCDTGGHTACVKYLTESLFDNKKIPLFLSRIETTAEVAPNTMSFLEKYCNVFGVNYHSTNFIQSLIQEYNSIIQNLPQVIFIYIHPNDILSTALIHLLKINTNIKFVYCNHASHFPNLGMTMADIIVEGTPTTAEITEKKRNLSNYKIIGIQSKKLEQIKYYSKEKIAEKKYELGIPTDKLLTVSGGMSAKYFDENKSEHYEMIRRLLEKIPNLYHLAITNFSDKEKLLVDEIFKNSSDAYKRLIIHPLTPHYDILFQCADLFIDSFPMSSAMTQIDLMSMKVPTTIYKNKNKPEYDFSEYMPADYPYTYSDALSMEKGITELLNDKDKRKVLSESNYKYWLNNYESMCVKNKYQEIINELLKEKVELINFLDIPYRIQMETRIWRNSEDVTKWFKIPYIDEESHKKWLRSLKNETPTNIAFVIKYNNIFIGVTYFHSIDYAYQKADWGMYIYNTNDRNKGIGSEVLTKSIQYAFDKLGLKKICLDVLNTNEIAKKMYVNHGFKCCGNNNGFLKMELINKNLIENNCLKE